MTYRTVDYGAQFLKRLGEDVTLADGSTVVRGIRRDITEPELSTEGGGRDRVIRYLWVPEGDAFDKQNVTIGGVAFFASQAHGDDDGWVRMSLQRR